MGTNRVAAAEYLDPELPDRLTVHKLRVVRATPESLEGYGRLVDDPKGFPVEIVAWPVPGWRALDPDTGIEAGTTTGIFRTWWEGDFLFGLNEAVGARDTAPATGVAANHYLFGWSCDPRTARRDNPAPERSRVLLWHVNYHPDGGQLFFPLDGGAFLSPLALPGDDVAPGDFVAFHVDRGKGLYIHPGIWHEGVFPVAARGRFHDEQGRVHARVSCHLAREFGALLELPLAAPD